MPTSQTDIRDDVTARIIQALEAEPSPLATTLADDRGAAPSPAGTPTSPARSRTRA